MSGHANHKLNDTELFALGAFLKAREKQILAERPQHKLLAQQAKDALKFEITECNVRRARKAAGIKYSPSFVRADKGQPSRFHRHERILAALCAKLGEDMEALAAT